MIVAELSCQPWLVSDGGPQRPLCITSCLVKQP